MAADHDDTAAMPIRVAAFYQFVPLPDWRDLRPPLLAVCADLGIYGTVLLAREGINGTVAGSPEAIAALVETLQGDGVFGGRLDRLDLKYSTAATMPFGRLKVRLKREIVTLGHPGGDPTARVGTYVEPADWNALLDRPDILVLDTRNGFEVEMGSFVGAIDPKIGRFGEFPDFAARALDPQKHKTIAMFCTGGIRCEKASAYLLSLGFDEVFHLKGGILKYLETVQPANSRWSGDCFVFDERVALGHGLQQTRRDKSGSPADD